MLNKTRIAYIVILVFALVGFTIKFLYDKNYEFLGYIGVVGLFALILAAIIRKVVVSDVVLGGMLGWALLHLAGGAFVVHGKVLYHFMLLPISENILRYDQLVHIIGFGVATYLMYSVLRPMLVQPGVRPISFFVIIVFVGLGVGAVNEIVEFVATITLPNTNVGGYVNTSLDLVADLVGAVIAAVIAFRNEYRRG